MKARRKLVDGKYIMYDIEPGKSYIGDAEFRRKQSDQKGGTCWYYTLSLLRPRLGKNIEKLSDLPSASDDFVALAFLKVRELEKAASKLRKAITFATSNDLPFSMQVRLRNAADREFVNAVQGNIELYEKRFPYLSNHYIINEMAETFGIQKVFFDLENLNFNTLFQQLELHGPLMVHGHIGAPYYQQCTSTNFGSINYYDSNDLKVKKSDSTHTILIVGLEKEDDKEYVYFLDPNHSSKIYRIVCKVNFNDIKSHICQFSMATAYKAPLKLAEELADEFKNTLDRLRARL